MLEEKSGLEWEGVDTSQYLDPHEEIKKKLQLSVETRVKNTWLLLKNVYTVMYITKQLGNVTHAKIIKIG